MGRKGTGRKREVKGMEQKINESKKLVAKKLPCSVL